MGPIMPSQPKRASPDSAPSGDRRRSADEEFRGGAASADDAGTATGEADPSSSGAGVLQTMLADAFDRRVHPSQPFVDDDAPDIGEAPPEPIEPDAKLSRRADAKRSAARWRSRVVKSLIGLAVLVFAVWVPARQLFQVASAEAVVNAQIVTLRAPIEGTVAVDIGIPGIGVELGQSTDLLRILNPRADLFRLNEASQAVAASLDEQARIAADLRSRRTQQEELTQQVEDFRLARIDYLTALLVIPAGPTIILGDRDERVPFLRARLGQINPEGDAALIYDEQLMAAVSAFQSTRGMIEDGIVGPKTIAMLNGEFDPEPVKGHAAVIELDALRRGVFIGDSYNDRPSSAQRLDILAIEIAALESELAISAARHERLVESEARERAWVEQMSSAAITAPVDGRVWEVLTAPGEQVVVGQELVRMLDCANPLVTAAVSEAVYNQLIVGMAASFTFREGGEPMMGEVVQLTGFAAAPANLAITPSALRAESYRVTVAVPAIAEGEGCAVGRTGRVVFDTGR
jgi:hypothetical protein